MSKNHVSKSDVDKAADVVRDAQGEIVGRTRLQKIAYLFELMGVGEGFTFAYRNYGPYSDELTEAVQDACLLGLIEEKEKPSSWGGYFSIFSSEGKSKAHSSELRALIADQAVRADAVELELAATAAYLADKCFPDAWAETAIRKPNKATPKRVAGAKRLYESLRQIHTPKRLPSI